MTTFGAFVPAVCHSRSPLPQETLQCQQAGRSGLGSYEVTGFAISSLGAQTVKYLPTMQETWVQSLGREDPLEKAMAPHSSTLSWKIPWTEEPGKLQPVGSQRVRHD